MSLGRCLAAYALLATLPAGAAAQTSFLDLNATGNTFGSTAGTGAGSVFIRGSLGGNGVTIRIASNAASDVLTLNDTSFGSNWGASTVNGTSHQYNHSGIYSPATDNVDRVGFSKPASTAATTARVTITFDTAVKANTLFFHIANLDQTRFDFSQTANLTGLSVVSGNGGLGAGGTGVDGLGVSGKVLLDQNAATRNTGATQDADTGVPPSSTSLVARSAYGTVSFDSALDLQVITFDATTFSTAAGTDSGSFTLSVTPVPEPAAVLAVAAVGLAGWRRWRQG